MAQGNCQNFSELYRAAFAERDPDRKLELLGQVRKAIEEWELLLQNWVAPDSAAGSGRFVPESASKRFVTAA
jgi:hypothetical protein